MCLADTRLFLPGLNLAYTDRASMAASTEVRVPFVDPVVFRAAFSLAGKEKVSGRSGKIALKHAAEAWLPNEIVHRPKASFSAPLRAWVTRDLREVIDDSLLGGELVGTGFLNRPAVSVARRRAPVGARGPVQADLAAAHPRVLVPPNPSSRSRAVTPVPRRESGRPVKQVAQNYRSGELAVIDAPAPSCAPGGVLVRSLYSLISTGTELMKVGESKMSLVGKARARPDQVKKVLETVQQQGALTTYKKAMNRLDSYSPLGYSLAGVVQEVGKGAEEFAVGQLVACAGNEFALHAEINWVPTNLCVAVPDGVSPQLAAFATVGSIALQGVRQGNVQIGDTACVIGLGLVGQLVVQLLVASGVQVVGLDPDEDRCRLAEKAGALLCAAPDEDGSAAVEQALFKASGGLGADRIFLVAGGSSNQPVELAARLARDRATVVDIGKCKLDLPWNDYYEKELDLRFSRSYGPGRYDPKYEVDGVDYPAGYVRWTERRNLHCFVNAVARKEIDPEPLIAGIFPLRDAPSVYEQLGTGVLQGVGIPLRV